MNYLKFARPLLLLFSVLLLSLLIKILFYDEQGTYEKQEKISDIYFSHKGKRSPSAWDFGKTISEKILIVKFYSGDSIVLSDNYMQFWDDINNNKNLDEVCQVSFSKSNDLVNHLIVGNEYVISKNYLKNNSQKIQQLITYALFVLILLLLLSFREGQNAQKDRSR